MALRVCKSLKAHPDDGMISVAAETYWRVKRTGVKGTDLLRHAKRRIRFSVIDHLRHELGRSGSPRRESSCRACAKELADRPDPAVMNPLDTLANRERLDGLRRELRRALVGLPIEHRFAVVHLLRGSTLREAGLAVGRSESWSHLLLTAIGRYLRGETPSVQLGQRVSASAEAVNV